MSQVIADMSMSLDGYVARPDDRIDDLLGWMFAGDVEVATPKEGVSFRAPSRSVEVLRGAFQNVGALVGGRRYFDLANGWDGEHPMGVPVFIVTHEPPADWPQDSPIKFVTDGVESAVRQAKTVAGDKIVGVASPSLVQQCLDAGLVDGVSVHVVPVVLGDGIPFFPNLGKTPVKLETPEVTESDGVTHLHYRVARA